MIVTVGIVFAGAAAGWRSWNSVENQVRRRKSRARRLKLIEKTHEIIETLGSENRLKDANLRLARNGGREEHYHLDKLSEGDQRNAKDLGAWSSLSIESDGVQVFEASNCVKFTPAFSYYDNDGDLDWCDSFYSWNIRIDGYIPGPWEEHFLMLHGKAVKKAARLRADQQRQQADEEDRKMRESFGIK